jgi:TRAP-type C4-dicarboxylate transport system permease small subunit
MNALFRFVRTGLVKGLSLFLIVSFAILTINVLWGVFTRYVLNHEAKWTGEVAVQLLVWISLLGAALTYEEHGHLGVDYIIEKLDPGARRLSAIVVECIVLFFALGVLVAGGWVLVFETLAKGQINTTLGVKVGYLYAAVPISGIFFTLFACEHLYSLCFGERRDPSTDLYNPKA